MALNSSGPISFGGSTVGQSINLELGVSATALASINSTSFRTLAGVASGQISLSNFYGKSNATFYFAVLYDPTGGYDTPGTVFSQIPQNSCVMYDGTYFYGSGPKCVASPSSDCIVKFSNTMSFAACSTYTSSTNGNQFASLSKSGTNIAIYSGGAANTILLSNDLATVSSANKPTSGWNQAVNLLEAVNTDSSGNLYYCVRFGSGSGGDFGLAKFNTSGTLQWSNESNNGGTGAGTGQATNLAVNSSGTSVINWQASNVSTSDQVHCFNSSGTRQWSVTVGGSYQRVRNIRIADSGNVYLMVGNNDNVYLTKLNTSGVVQWTRLITGCGSSYTDIYIDSSENVYTASYVYTAGYYVCYLIKFNSSGTVQWQRGITNYDTLQTMQGGNSNNRSISDAPSGICLTWRINDFYRNRAFFLIYPADGSKTGSWSVASTSVSVFSGSLTIASSTAITTSSYTPSMTTSSPSYTSLTSAVKSVSGAAFGSTTI